MKLAPSKATSFVQALAVIALTVGFVACQQAPNGSPQTPAATPAGQVPMVEGGSSGGGGYVSENSALLLEQSSQKLASMIRKSTPAIYSDLPQGWSAERLARIIENVRSSPNKDIHRDGKDLMFNYGVDADGTEYIEALKPFFHIYGAVPVKIQKPDQLLDIHNDLMLKIFHETAHLMDLNEKNVELFERKAEAFAYDKLLEMDLDIYTCISNESFDIQSNNKEVVRLEPGIAIRRSKGDAFRMPNLGEGVSYSQPLNDDGVPLYGKSLGPAKTRVFSKKGRTLGSIEKTGPGFMTFSKSVTETAPQSLQIENVRGGTPSVYDGKNWFFLDSNVLRIEFGNDEKTGFINKAYVVEARLFGDTAPSEPQSGTLTCRWRSDYMTTVPVEK